eukprot:2912201-Prymnesium_polylepis.1
MCIRDRGGPERHPRGTPGSLLVHAAPAVTLALTQQQRSAAQASREISAAQQPLSLIHISEPTRRS